MRKWLVGLIVIFAVLCVLCAYNLAGLLQHPNLHVPSRQYPADNAYQHLREMADRLYQQNRGDSQLATIRRKLSERRGTQLTPAEEQYLLQRYAPFLQEYPQYLNKPSVVVMEYSPLWLMPELSMFRDLARVETYQIRKWLQTNQDRKAVQAFDQLLRLSNQIRNEGGLIHSLVGIAITSIAQRPFLENPSLLDDPKAMEQIIKAIRQFERQRFPAWKTIQQEHYFVRAIFNGLASGQYSSKELFQQDNPAPFMSNILVMRYLVNRSVPEMEQLMAQSVEELKKPYWERKPLPEPKQFLNSLLVPVFTGFSSKDAQELAFLRLQATLCAVRLYKKRTGTYPKQLRELALGDLAIDPFTGKPFVYRVEPKRGFLLYSLGENGVDDGGRIEYRYSGKQGDIAPVRPEIPKNLSTTPAEHLPLAPPYYFK